MHAWQLIRTGSDESGLEESLYVEEEEPSVETDAEANPVNRRPVALPARQAQPPCRPTGGPTVAPAPSPKSRHPGGWLPRIRKTRAYIRWVQRSINVVLGTRLVVDGILGPNTRRAISRFQRHVGITVDGRIGPQTQGALRKWTRTDPPTEGAAESPILTAKTLGTAIQFADFGIKVIGKIAAGDVNYQGPQGAIGIKASNVPPHFLLKPRRDSKRIINFTEESIIGVEQVKVKLRCNLQYDGLRLNASFGFDAGGRRSRLGRDTRIAFRPALGLDMQAAPVAWRRCGVAQYPVLRIPIEFSVNRPWPLSNYHETFQLVLSTMYGFGATAGRRRHIDRLVQRWN